MHIRKCKRILTTHHSEKLFLEVTGEGVTTGGVHGLLDVL